jgi:hypothetical protein
MATTSCIKTNDIQRYYRFMQLKNIRYRNDLANSFTERDFLWIENGLIYVKKIHVECDKETFNVYGYYPYSQDRIKLTKGTMKRF